MNTDKYIYCTTCDIWYNKELKQRGDRERAEVHKFKYPTMPFLIVDCPLCKSKQVLSASMKNHCNSSHFATLHKKSK